MSWRQRGQEAQIAAPLNTKVPRSRHRGFVLLPPLSTWANPTNPKSFSWVPLVKQNIKRVALPIKTKNAVCSLETQLLPGPWPYPKGWSRRRFLALQADQNHLGCLHLPGPSLSPFAIDSCSCSCPYPPVQELGEKAEAELEHQESRECWEPHQR